MHGAVATLPLVPSWRAEQQYRLKRRIYGGCNWLTSGSTLSVSVYTSAKGVNPLWSSGHYMYRTVVTIRTASLTFNNSTFCPHSVFMCFVWIWEQTAIISLYSINWLVCITETECIYCAVRTEHVTFNNSTFCPHSAFMCFVWIWVQTAIISLYSINWLVCITETECVYCAVRAVSVYIINVL
jgi:hypothetical protein